jgi:DNA-binding NarL/FixJ family response regulator
VADPLAVIDPLPVYRRGIAAVLATHGFEVHTPADVVAWAREHPRGPVLLSVLSDDDWDLLGALCRLRPRPPIIAVTTEDSGSGVRALLLGARSVLLRSADVPAVERAVVATVEGEAVMPAAVANALCTARPPAQVSRPALSAEQVAWLRDLSAGRTVAALAKEAGYSERAMYRFLRDVYARLGVRTRIEAIVRMQEAGWLTGEVRTADPPDRAG